MDIILYPLDSFLARMILKSVSRLSDKDRDAFFDSYSKNAKADSEGERVIHDVKLLVDGQELPVESVFEQIEKEIDGMVEERALELAEEKLDSIQEDIYKISDVISEMRVELINRIREKLGIKVGEEN